MSLKFRFIFFSVLLHLALGLFFFNQKPLTHLKQKPALVVNIIPSESLKKGGALAKTSFRNSFQKGKGAPSMDAFFPKYKIDPALANRDMVEDTYLTTPQSDNPQAEWGSGSGSFGRIQDFNFFRVLYQQVDGSLSYPSVLAHHDIKGTINARIVIGNEGNCDWRMTQIHGPEPYLSLYVLNILKNVCKMNFKKYIPERRITNADLSFQFDMSENDDWQRIEKEKIIIGNTLLFYRNSHKSIAEWELGPFKGMFPVPMIYLNIPWIQDNWENLVNKKDPLTEFKKQFGEG